MCRLSARSPTRWKYPPPLDLVQQFPDLRQLCPRNFLRAQDSQHELLGSTGERPIEEISHKTQLSFLDRNSPNAIPSSQEDR